MPILPNLQFYVTSDCTSWFVWTGEFTDPDVSISQSTKLSEKKVLPVNEDIFSLAVCTLVGFISADWLLQVSFGASKKFKPTTIPLQTGLSVNPAGSGIWPGFGSTYKWEHCSRDCLKAVWSSSCWAVADNPLLDPTSRPGSWAETAIWNLDALGFLVKVGMLIHAENKSLQFIQPQRLCSFQLITFG